ncbi:MAG: sugar phosphate isomerase/epimerase [Bacteroidales bacterium]|nr:sugar phosphate isomerase/epimerase [Bacteroidales bacterium]
MHKILVTSLICLAMPVLFTGCHRKAAFRLDEHIGICGLDHASAAVACGLDYLEAGVASFLVPEMDDEAFAVRRRAADTLGLPIYSANGFFPGDIRVVGPDADLERAVRYSETALRRASEVGMKVLVLGSSRSRQIPEGFSREEAEAQFLALLKGIAPAAEKYGVLVAIEPLQKEESNFINTVREGADLARRAGSPNICVLADLFHMAREKEDPADIVEAADKLVHCHIAECARRTPPGVDGDDFTPYFKALRQIGYKGRISFECGWSDVAAQLPVAFNVMKEQIQSVR